MSNTNKTLAVFALCGMALIVSGCGQQSDPIVPSTATEKIKAIEANPDYKPEQKEAFKKQVMEVEKARAIAAKLGPGGATAIGKP